MRHRAFPTLALLAVLAFAACGSNQAPPAGHVDTRVPDYAAFTFEGDTVTLASLRGQVLLVNFWATWCPPCRREIPEIEAIHRRWADRGLHVIGVSIDAPGDRRLVREFMRSRGMTYRVLLDPHSTVLDVFSLHGVPVTLLIDRDGIVRWRRLGPIQPGDPELERAIDRLL